MEPKDHTIFFHDGYSYIISIPIPLPSNDEIAEKNFMYARTVFAIGKSVERF